MRFQSQRFALQQHLNVKVKRFEAAPLAVQQCNCVAMNMLPFLRLNASVVLCH